MQHEVQQRSSRGWRKMGYCQQGLEVQAAVRGVYQGAVGSPFINPCQVIQGGLVRYRAGAADHVVDAGARHPDR